MSENLAFFNKFTAETFAALFANFTVPQYVSFKAYSAELTDAYWSDPNSQSSKATIALRSMVEGTFNFLRENGHISYKTSQEGFNDVRLTEKALVALNIKPNSLTNTETIGVRIMSAVKEGTHDVIAGAVNNLLSIGVRVLID